MYRLKYKLETVTSTSLSMEYGYLDYTFLGYLGTQNTNNKLPFSSRNLKTHEQITNQFNISYVESVKRPVFGRVKLSVPVIQVVRVKIIDTEF